MNILVTGGTGYIGSHTALALVEAGYRVVLMDNLRQSNPSVGRRLEALTGKAIPLVIGDLCDTVLTTSTLVSQQIDAVVHCAGYKGMAACLTQPIEAYINNVQATLSLVHAMALCEVGTLVYTSSSAVYGESQTMRLEESHRTQPSSTLGRSILQAEQMIHDVVENTHHDWRVAILRCFNPAGAHDSGLIGDCRGLTAISEGLIPKLARVAAKEDPFLAVHMNYTGSPDGTAVRDYTHVTDLANGHVAALQMLLRDGGLHTINLGRGKPVTVAQAITAFEAVSGQHIDCSPADWAPEDVCRCVANPTLAQQLLGWQAREGLSAICDSTWNHLLTQTMLYANAVDGVSS